MKKKLLILPIILFLTGCSNNKLNIETADNRQEVLKINHDYFEKNINEKKDFIILISLSTCLNCLKVKSILNDYIKEKNKLEDIIYTSNFNYIYILYLYRLLNRICLYYSSVFCIYFLDIYLKIYLSLKSEMFYLILILICDKFQNYL